MLISLIDDDPQFSALMVLWAEAIDQRATNHMARVSGFPNSNIGRNVDWTECVVGPNVIIGSESGVTVRLKITSVYRNADEEVTLDESRTYA
jgi:hypothetical protein